MYIWGTHLLLLVLSIIFFWGGGARAPPAPPLATALGLLVPADDFVVSSQPSVCRSRKDPSREGSLRDRHTDGCEETNDFADARM